MKKHYMYSDRELKDFAKKVSQSVVIRSYEGGSSVDTRRVSFAGEAALLERVIASALLAIRAGYDVDSVKATAEFFIIYEGGENNINTYDSVSIPINNFLAGL